MQRKSKEPASVPRSPNSAERGEILHCHIGIKVVFYMIIVAVYNITINGIRAVSAGIQKYVTF